MARKNRKSDAAEPNAAGHLKNLTPVDIQQKEFSVAARPFRGYDEQEVDSFLDQVTEEMARLHAENRRLQEDAESRRTVPLDGDAAVVVERILRDARDQAARIVAEARGRAGAPEGSPGGGLEAGAARLEMLNRFLSREREFLQGLAMLIQQHAEAVKTDARSVRESPRARATVGGEDGAAVDAPGATVARGAPEIGTAGSGEASTAGDAPETAEPDDSAEAPEAGAVDSPPGPEEPAAPAAPDPGEPSRENAPAPQGRTGLEAASGAEGAGGSLQTPDHETWRAIADPSVPDDEALAGAAPSAAASGLADAPEPAGTFASEWEATPAPPADAIFGPETEAEQAVEVPEADAPESIPVGAGASPEDEADQARSLRELFWGEE